MRRLCFVFVSLLAVLLLISRAVPGEAREAVPGLPAVQLPAAQLSAAQLSAAQRSVPQLSFPELPVLVVQAPDSLSALAARVHGYDPARLAIGMRLTGLDRPGPPITVLLAPEGSDAARAAPSWAEGYAYGERGIVVLIPSRSSSYPYGSLEVLLHHEVTHVLIARAAGGRPVPRWFDEGLAMAAAREWDLGDRARLVVELLPGSRVDLDELNGLFEQGSSAAARAYSLSGAFVRDILQRHGMDAPARTLGLLARGASFEESFFRATGRNPAQALQAFYSTQNLWSRWVPFLTSSLTLWMGITMLLLWAVRRRRLKDARKKEEWEREETLLDPMRGNGEPPASGSLPFLN